MRIDKSKLLKPIVFNLIACWLLPLVTVLFLKHYRAGDTTALMIGGCIPVAVTLFTFIVRRRVQLLGLVSILVFTVVALLTLLTGSNSLPMKIYHPIITGLIGSVLLISAAINKPLLAWIIAKMKPDISMPQGEEARKRRSFLTAFVGFIFLSEALIHIGLALALSTEQYLIWSRIITIGTVGLLLGIRFYTSRK